MYNAQFIFIVQRLGAPEDKSFGSSVMGTEVNLDSYQTALEEVLSWLLSAEDTLQAQGEISSDVEEVKEQFHTHEVKQNIDLGDKARASSSRQVSVSQSLPKILVFL